MGPAGPSGLNGALVVTGRQFPGGAAASQGIFDCPAGMVGAGLDIEEYAGSVALGLRCHSIVVDDVAGLVTSGGPSIPGFLGSSYAVANGPTEVLACSPTHALIGITYQSNAYGNVSGFEGLCREMDNYLGGGLQATAAAGVFVEGGAFDASVGPIHSVWCPAYQRVVGIGGNVDTNGSPTRLVLRCN